MILKLVECAAGRHLIEGVQACLQDTPIRAQAAWIASLTLLTKAQGYKKPAKIELKAR